MHEKGVTHERGQTTTKAIWARGWGRIYNFYKSRPPPPAQQPSVVGQPYHAAPKVECLLIKDNKGTNVLLVNFVIITPKNIAMSQ